MDKEQQEALLSTLEGELAFYKGTIKEVVDEVLSSEVSKYPIFIAHTKDIDIGRMILSKDTFGTHWNISASTLEEFVIKNLVHKGRVDAFRKVYKNPQEHCCLFVIMDKEAQFIFIPY